MNQIVDESAVVTLEQVQFVERRLYARIRIGDREWYLRDLVRLVEGIHYSERMKRAGVPDKVRLKILRRWKPMIYAFRREMAGVVRDLQQRLGVKTGE